MRRCCNAAKPRCRRQLGTQATAARSQSYYLDVTPPGYDKGTFVQAMAKRLGISTDAVATIGDMQNDLAMFRKSGMSIAMGNATDDIKKQATHVTTSNQDEGFAGAIDIVMKHNEAIAVPRRGVTGAFGRRRRCSSTSTAASPAFRPASSHR